GFRGCRLRQAPHRTSELPGAGDRLVGRRDTGRAGGDEAMTDGSVSEGVPADGGAAEMAAQTPITGVTVFRDGARGSRTGQLDVPPGLRRTGVGALPRAADPASVRVAVRGHGVALLEVQVERRFQADPLRDEHARLRDEVEKLRDAVKEIADEDAAES